jgi:hypothetical protein
MKAMITSREICEHRCRLVTQLRVSGRTVREAGAVLRLTPEEVRRYEAKARRKFMEPSALAQPYTPRAIPPLHGDQREAKASPFSL